MSDLPQTWYAWRRVMPLLAGSYRVVAADLPGQVDSEAPATRSRDCPRRSSPAASAC